MDSNKNFTIGCNYWASNAGVYMWRNFDETAVEKDLIQMKEAGIDSLRVFPLWEDFQPLYREQAQNRFEFSVNGKPLDSSPEGVAGVSPLMMDRFERLLILCEKYGFKVLVCLINGWMSGKLFYPPAFANINVITDKTAIKWQIRFVRYMVNRFKKYDCISAWETGNESNVMSWAGDAVTPKDGYFVWLSTLVTTIKSIDNSRPVIAGMHGLEMNGHISPREVGEICDVMTVHPYAGFVPHCFTDTIDSMKTRLHPVAESALYSDLSNKPCLCEEIGTFGYALGSDEMTSQFIKVNSNSLWANGSTGIVWWCAYDQNEFSFFPYEWNGLERELGIFKFNRDKKPVVDTLVDFQNFLCKNEALPPHNRHAVCLLTPCQDNWGVAYGSYILAKQAGFDIRFADATLEIPEAPVYMLPSVCDDAMPKRCYDELLRRVRDDGAVLYISYNNAYFSEFADATGLKIMGNKQRDEKSVIALSNGEKMPLFAQRKQLLCSVGAEVLATEEDGNVALAVKNLGKGKVYFLNFAPELYLVDETDAFDKNYYKLYEYIFSKHLKCAVVDKSSQYIGLTEHSMPDGSVTVTAINYADKTIDFTLKIAENFKFNKAIFGDAFSENNMISSSLGAGEMIIINLKEK